MPPSSPQLPAARTSASHVPAEARILARMPPQPPQPLTPTAAAAAAVVPASGGGSLADKQEAQRHAQLMLAVGQCQFGADDY